MSVVSKQGSHSIGASRIVRYDDLRPCFDAFIDTHTPGSDKKENFTIIGPGVSENPSQYVHIAEPHGFNVGGARQPPGCVNSQHSHDTAEVFFVHSGTWSFDLGQHGDDANITLKPGDLISIPTQVFRGFKNIGKDIGFLWGILGEDDPGRVMWAPDVFDMAKNYGLVLMENGMLIDTNKGQAIPEGGRVMPITSAEQIAELNVFDDEMLRKCCILNQDLDGTGIRPVIGSDAPLSWPHGFKIDDILLRSDEELGPIESDRPDVVFVHEGGLIVDIDHEVWSLEAGDTATIPRGATRLYRNAGDGHCRFLRVQGQ